MKKFNFKTFSPGMKLFPKAFVIGQKWNEIEPIPKEISFKGLVIVFYI